MTHVIQSLNEVQRLTSDLLPTLHRITYYSQVLIGDYKYSSRSNDEIGWLMCDGRTVNRSDYPTLYSVIGTTFGSTNASNFKLPDLRGRVHGDAGSGTSLTSRDIGDVIGTETHTLTINEIPSHNHGGTTDAAGYAASSQAITAVAGAGISAGDDSGSHAHSISAQGGGLAHNNMQPTAFAGYTYIFAGITDDA